MLTSLPSIALTGLLALRTVSGQDAFECRSGVGWTKETMDKYEAGKVNLNGFYITRFYDLEWNCANASYPVSIFWVAGRENTVRYNTTNYFAVHSKTPAPGTMQNHRVDAPFRRHHKRLLGHLPIRPIPHHPKRIPFPAEERQHDG